MKGNRRSGTKPEMAVRREIHGRGFRFRVDHPVRCAGRTIRPDIVFTRKRICIFVDGCFWHVCPEHGHQPSGINRDYWSAKLLKNVERDERQTRALTSDGWTVLRFWEHEDPREIADEVVEMIVPCET